MIGPSGSSLYEVLGVLASAGPSEVRSAFKQQALATHPDKGGTKERFQLVVLAFETLSDPARRARYDQRFSADIVSAKRQNGAAMRVSRDTTQDHYRSRKDRKEKHCDQKPQDSRQKECNMMQQPDTKGCKRPNSQAYDEHMSADLTGAPTSSTYGPNWCTKILQALFSLLQQLNSEKRHKLLLESFSHSEKKQLESWALAHRRKKPVQVMELVQMKNGEAFSCSSDSDSTETDGSESLQALENESCCEDDNNFCNTSGPLAICNFDNSEEQVIGSTDAEDGCAAEQATCDRDDAPQKYRGIVSKRLKSGTVYYAAISVRFLVVRARFTSELSVALDDLVILTDWTRCVRQNAGNSFAEDVSLAFATVLSEHSTSAESLGLRMHLRLTQKFWLDRLMLITPVTHSISCVVADIHRIAPYYGSVGRTVFQRGGDINLEWQSFQEIYIDICEQRGWDTSSVRARLHKAEAESLPHRERKLEIWNNLQMRREDKDGRRSRRNRRAKQQRSQNQSDTVENRVLIRIGKLLSRWRRYENANKARRVRLASLEEQRQRKVKLQRAKEARMLAREEARAASLRRKCLAKNARHLTMEEIMSGR